MLSLAWLVDGFLGSGVRREGLLMEFETVISSVLVMDGLASSSLFSFSFLLIFGCCFRDTHGECVIHGWMD